jgi:tetratricopeptide (TPR) repeat protein/transcriptional regulator with XRE-family HTH domain
VADGGGSDSLLARCRKAVGLTQEELAELSGLSVRSISDIERGVVGRPRRQSLESITVALDLDDSARRALIDHYRLRSRTPPSIATGPAQLPACATKFSGRHEHLARLDALLHKQADAMVISAIDGMGGIGKTALALQWAHRVAPHFPDGQLYANLRGYSSAPPLEPAQVLEQFLCSLGKAGSDLPAGLDARAALFRSLLAERHVLVVLDNARNADQVRPLLPGRRFSLVVVTSRNQLRGLSIRDGAHRITLNQLPVAEATALLAELVGAGRVADEPEAAFDIVRRCAGLPLALRMIGDRAAREPSRSLADIAGELVDDRGRLDKLDADPTDTQCSIRAVCSWSYQALDPETARVFRLLALHPGHDIDRAAAGALAGAASTSLDTLACMHLLEQRQPGRWEFHDLLREYAAEKATECDAEHSRREALSRLLAHYQRVTAEAAHRCAPAQFPASGAGQFTDAGQATAWLDAERLNLISSAAWAADHGWPEYTSRMSDLLWRYLDVGAYYRDGQTLHSCAARTATGSGKSRALRYLGTACDRLGEHNRARDYYQQSLAIATDIGYQSGQRGAHNNLGISHWRAGEYTQARHHLRRALDLGCESGDRLAQAQSLGNLGLVHYRLGDLAQALTYQNSALAIACSIGDHLVETNSLVEIGEIYRQQGRYAEALANHKRALDNSRAAGNRDGERNALNNIGSLYRALGRYPEALAHHERALAMARDVGARHAQAETLNSLGETRRRMGESSKAVQLHHLAQVIAEDVGDPNEQARAQAGAGDALADLGNDDAARTYWQRALHLYTELGAAEATELHQRLS